MNVGEVRPEYPVYVAIGATQCVVNVSNSPPLVHMVRGEGQ